MHAVRDAQLGVIVLRRVGRERGRDVPDEAGLVGIAARVLAQTDGEEAQSSVDPLGIPGAFGGDSSKKIFSPRICARAHLAEDVDPGVP